MPLFGICLLTIFIEMTKASPIHKPQVQAQALVPPPEHFTLYNIFSPNWEPHDNPPWAATCVSSSSPVIALTFDDGPFIHTEAEQIYKASLNPADYSGELGVLNGRGTTDVLLDKLAVLSIPATFFVVGVEASTPAGRLLVKREFDEGHTVGAHSWNHKHLGTLSIDDGVSEMSRSVDLVSSITGVVPSFVRSPYGERPDYIRDWEASQGLTEIYWRIVGGEGADMLNNIDLALTAWKKTGKPWPNPIVLFHDWSPFTIVHLEEAVQKFRDAVPGVNFVDMYDCLNVPNPRR